MVWVTGQMRVWVSGNHSKGDRDLHGVHLRLDADAVLLSRERVQGDQQLRGRFEWVAREI